MCSVVSNTFLQTWTIPEHIKAFFALTTDNYFDMRRLPWITVLILAVTYLAMLNVDHIARVLSWRPLLPQRYKLSVLEKMSRYPDRMWRERGALLNANNAATPAHADTSVSSWGVHEYFILNWRRERKERKRIERRDRPPLNTDGGRRWQWARILKPRFLTGWVKTPHITPARNGTGAHRREEEEILGNTEGMEVDEISITRPEPAHVRNTLLNRHDRTATELARQSALRRISGSANENTYSLPANPWACRIHQLQTITKLAPKSQGRGI
jgi:hypothetical protein